MPCNPGSYNHPLSLRIFLGYCLLGYNLGIMDVWSDIDCAHHCLSDQRCASVNCRKHNNKSISRRCQLNSRNRSSRPEDFAFDKHCDYYEQISEVSTCQISNYYNYFRKITEWRNKTDDFNTGKISWYRKLQYNCTLCGALMKKCAVLNMKICSIEI